MTIKLYDLFSTPKTESDARPTFLMRAPLTTIERYLDLHESAVKRVTLETEQPGGICTLHFSRGAWATHRLDVARASLPLLTER